MILKPVFTNTLPEINYSNQFIIHDDARDELGKDWLKFVKLQIEMAHEETPKHFIRIRNSVPKGTPIINMSRRAKNHLGIGRLFCVVDVDFDGNNNLSPVPHKSYEELIREFYSDNRKENGMPSIRSLIDIFFGWQWSRGKLLYPMGQTPDSLNRFDVWYDIVGENAPILKLVQEWFLREEDDRSNTVKVRRGALARLFITTTWYAYDDFNEEKILQCEEIAKKHLFTSQKSYQSNNFFTLVINELRHMLIDRGFDNIRTPSDIAKEKKLQNMGFNKSFDERFNWVNIIKYPHLRDTQEKIVEFLQHLKEDGLAASTLSGKVSVFNRLLEFLIAKTPTGKPLSVDLVDTFFEPEGERNLLDFFIENYDMSRDNALGYLYQLIQFFAYNELYSTKARKNTPVMKVRRAVTPYRRAMPKEMVSHIVDILLHRPPSSSTRWLRNKADISWWPFDAYPVLPILMLIGYCIPVRGEQLRWLCRDHSFVYSLKGDRIETIVISTDKNVNRKMLQEIPNVWDVLDILIPFLKWHKAYFPNMKKVQYHNDDNSPWGEIVPVMNLANEYKPISNASHMEYHKRVLCQYQIEMMEKTKEEGKSHYPIVAKFKDGRPFFSSVEELNAASGKEMKEIEVVYDIHSIRVTGATRYLEAGAGLKTVMELTGHANSETLMRVYISLTREEKERTLRSAVHEIFFGDKEKLTENVQEFVNVEMTGAFVQGEEVMAKTIKNNELFSLYRKSQTGQGRHSNLQQGADIALKTHPSLWIPMIYGICPGVKCPEGRENKCSLCPYLVTGKLFMDGIVHKLNLLFAAFKRESEVVYSEDKTKGYNNHAKAEELETMLEEILGWQEIIETIENRIKKEESCGLEAKELVPGSDDKSGRSIFVAKMIPEEIAYLENAYDAHLMGVEQDRCGMKVLTIKAMQLAAKMGDTKQIDSIGKDEFKAIDLLMGHYLGRDKVKQKEEVKALISSIGILPQKEQKHA